MEEIKNYIEQVTGLPLDLTTFHFVMVFSACWILGRILKEIIPMTGEALEITSKIREDINKQITTESTGGRCAYCNGLKKEGKESCPSCGAAY